MSDTRYVTISRAAELTGYTEKAIRGKIANQIWEEWSVWFRAPDGRIMIDLRGYEEWAVSGADGSEHLQVATRSPSPTEALSAKSGSSSSPAPLTTSA